MRTKKPIFNKKKGSKKIKICSFKDRGGSNRIKAVKWPILRNFVWQFLRNILPEIYLGKLRETSENCLQNNSPSTNLNFENVKNMSLISHTSQKNTQIYNDSCVEIKSYE